MNIEILLPYLVATLGVLVLVLIIWITFLHTKLKKFTTGANGASLESSIKDLALQFHTMQKFYAENRADAERIEAKVRRSIQAVETIRFDAYADAGGKQSFATALVDEEGNGVVISTLFSRERMSVFAKPLQQSKSAYELSEEERLAVRDALSRISRRP